MHQFVCMFDPQVVLFLWTATRQDVRLIYSPSFFLWLWLFPELSVIAHCFVLYKIYVFNKKNTKMKFRFKNIIHSSHCRSSPGASKIIHPTTPLTRPASNRHMINSRHRETETAIEPSRRLIRINVTAMEISTLHDCDELMRFCAYVDLILNSVLNKSLSVFRTSTIEPLGVFRKISLKGWWRRIGSWKKFISCLKFQDKHQPFA